MLIALHDSEFSGQESMVLGKVPRYIRYVRDAMDLPVTLFTDRRIFGPDPQRVQSPVKLAWLLEPRGLRSHYYTDIEDVADRFDQVFTYDSTLLSVLPNAHWVPGGGVWIPQDQWGMHPKTRLCSFLIGDKQETEGHRFRHEVADALYGLVDFYGVRGTPVGYGPQTKFDVLAPYAFSVIVNSCREPGLFDELIMDCFAVGTIPIFWGCPNIGRWFVQEAILPFKTVDECVQIVRSLSMDRYHELSQLARWNLRRVEPYAVTEDWLYQNTLKQYDTEQAGS